MAASLLACAGCGSGEVALRAREAARDSLQRHLEETAECLASAFPPARGVGSDELKDRLAGCANVSILNLDEADANVDQLDFPGEPTIALRGDVRGSKIDLELVVQGFGRVQAGVTSDQASAAACVRVSIDGEDQTYTDVECRDAVLELIEGPVEVVPLSRLDVPGVS